MSHARAVTEMIAGLPKYTSSLFTAGISRFPTTPGQHVIVLHSSYFFALNDHEQDEVLQFAQKFAGEVRSVTRVKRCGLAYDGYQCLQIIPMHGLNEDWKPILAPDTELQEHFPGYLWTKNSPHMAGEALTEIQRTLAAASGWTAPDYTFFGDCSDKNLFACLVRGQIPQWRIWENGQHVAFLTPFANTPGYSVLIPRQHLGSDIFSLPEKDFRPLMRAANQVANTLHAGLRATRVGMFFEGFEIDYAHVKLVPILGDKEPDGPSEEFHETYPGYLTTRLGPEETHITKLEVYR